MNLTDERELWPFERTPRKVQIAALQAGLFQHGFAYFMRMRLGKTGVALAEYELYRSIDEVSHLLVVCPNSLKGQWYEAVKEWGIKTPVFVYEATKKWHAERFLQRNKQSIMILNYDSLRTYIESGLYRIIDPSHSMIVFDESTAIKDPSAVRTKTALKYAPDYKYVRILTGKPKANSNADLYAQMRIIGGHNEMSFYSWRNTFCKMSGGPFNKIVGDQNNEYLQQIIAPYVFIAGDEYLTDIPQKVYMPLREVQMTRHQAAIYKEMEANFLAEIEDTTSTAPIVLTKYLRLRQITSGFATTEDGEVKEIMQPLDNPRIRAVLDMMENELTGKVLIVACFKYSIKALEYALGKYKPVKIVGGMSSEDITKAQHRFNNDPECRVLIGQEQVLQFGHTLPGPDDDPCDTIIFYENSFSLINRAQCEARPEKVGRHVPIGVVDFFSSKMDKYLINTLRKKEDAALALMGYSRARGIFGNEAD